MTPLIELHLKHPSWLDSTKEEHLVQGRSKQLSNYFFQENLLDMPSQREPKPSPNTPMDEFYIIKNKQYANLYFFVAFNLKYLIRLG